MILQGKEDPSNPQLPSTTHTQHSIKASSSGDPSTNHGQQVWRTSDIDPPPYSNLDPNNPSSASGSAAVVPVPGGVPANTITLNTIRLEKLSDSITGTYIIDPNASQDEPSSLQGFVAKHSVLGLGKAAFDFLSTPHAVFRSRFGSISLTLATKGSSERCHRAIINVSTHHGDITVDLSSIHPGKRITLKVTSHRGKIVVLLPRTFYGDVQIRSNKFSGYDILPGLSSSIRSMKGRRGKASLRVGDSPPTSEGNPIMDHCRLSSRSGKIVLGLSGEDRMPAQRQGGFRGKIGAFFRGIGS